MTPVQGSLFVPTQAGEQPMQARLLSRRDDPDTSKAAAVRMVGILSDNQAWALRIVQRYGPGTCRELATAEEMPTWAYHELARRLPELERDGLVRTTGERRNGSRVWETV